MGRTFGGAIASGSGHVGGDSGKRGRGGGRGRGRGRGALMVVSSGGAAPGTGRGGRGGGGGRGAFGPTATLGGLEVCFRFNSVTGCQRTRGTTGNTCTEGTRAFVHACDWWDPVTSRHCLRGHARHLGGH